MHAYTFQTGLSTFKVNKAAIYGIDMKLNFNGSVNINSNEINTNELIHNFLNLQQKTKSWIQQKNSKYLLGCIF